MTTFVTFGGPRTPKINTIIEGTLYMTFMDRKMQG